ncbi:hypothetical protein TNCV_799091 [Trichonephila clavipes]|nr:hypothetical protein TNCV_799091 [Trichonephila clavipes]
MEPRQRREKDAVHITSGSPMKEGRFVLGTFRSEGMRVLNRSRQNDRLRVMLEHSEILTPNLTDKIIENLVASVGAPYDDPSRTPIARSVSMLFTFTTPGGFYDEY